MLYADYVTIVESFTCTIASHNHIIRINCAAQWETELYWLYTGAGTAVDAASKITPSLLCYMCWLNDASWTSQ
jgi:hypothetical protein